jgi:hypothetical protein
MANKDEIRIYGVSQQVRSELKTIASNKGITLAAYLKPKLREIIDAEPPNLKRPTA